MTVHDNDRIAGGEPRRDWQDEVGDLLEKADLPAPPADDDPFTPGDADLRAAYDLERSDRFILEALRSRMDYDLWLLRRSAIADAEETAEEPRAAFRALDAAGRIRAFAEEELEEASPCEDECCDHGRDEESIARVAKYREVIGNLAILEGRIRRLNPAAAAEFDRERS